MPKVVCPCHQDGLGGIIKVTLDETEVIEDSIEGLYVVKLSTPFSTFFTTVVVDV